jgi:hypothetical protein
VSALLVLTGIGPVLAFADFIVMCVFIQYPMTKKKKRKTAATAQATMTGKSGFEFMLCPFAVWW